MSHQLRTIPLAIAAVGMTVDGREITEKDIDDIVDTYNYNKYGARINLDHEGEWSGWAAKNLHVVDLPGGMLGDVLELTSATNEDGVKVLLAVLAPNASFVLLNQADQAVYFSIEIDRNFLKTERTYLTGLAVTDYPASTYTTRVNFNNSQPDNESTPNYLAKIEFEPFNQESAKKPSIFKNLFTPKDDDNMKPEELAQALAQSLGEPLAQFTKALNDNTQAVNTHFGNQEQDDNESTGIEESTDSNQDVAKLSQQIDGLQSSIKTLGDSFARIQNQESNTNTQSDEFHLDNEHDKNLL